MPLDPTLLQRAADVARGLALDAIAGCSSGHLGLPLGAAETGAALFGSFLRFHPGQPRWINRDRFVLSAGHGSMFLYAWLHLSGYDLSLDDLKAFRSRGSKTPGHPEFGETPGVEVTSGPLGQGVGNAVGMALAGRLSARRWNTPRHALFDYRVVCLAGDGCLQEGVALEATELAGHLGLDNLILVWDSNAVTLDAMAEVTQSQDVRARYEACGWTVRDVDGHDLPALLATFKAAREAGDGRPQLVIARTLIARGVPEVAGTPKGHGESGAKFASAAKRALGLPEETFQVPGDVRDAFAARRRELESAYARWLRTWEDWRRATPELAAELDARLRGEAAEPEIPEFPAEAALATRKSASIALQAVAAARPELLSLSADLFGSNLNHIDGGGDILPGDFAGRNLRVGVREHAMGAVLNGLAYDGLWRGLGATFLVFADYLRPAIRLAALARLPVIHWFTHDSAGVGEDGPTHQPIETTSALRLLPDYEVYRPADAEECAGALLAALARLDGPTALALSRQNLPALSHLSAGERRRGTARGGYVLLRESGPLELVLLAAGSEVALVLEAARTLAAEGRGVRVVSMPSMERFLKQDAEWRERVLPAACRRRLAVEAGVGALWNRFTGLDGAVHSVERFGLSAPGAEALAVLGMSVGAVLEAARELLAR